MRFIFSPSTYIKSFLLFFMMESSISCFVSFHYEYTKIRCQVFFTRRHMEP